MEFGQRTSPVAGGHVGDQVADGGAAYVLGGAGLSDAKSLVALGQAALLVVGTGCFDPQSRSALGHGDMAAHEGRGSVQGDAGVTEGDRGAHPTHPRIALVHGTDLIFAEAHRDQLQVLRATARDADAIVVPTGAMADHLLKLAPQTDRRKIVHIPWGIPDRLLSCPPFRTTHPSRSHLRLLYAGRLTAEKGVEA